MPSFEFVPGSEPAPKPRKKQANMPEPEPRDEDLTPLPTTREALTPKPGKSAMERVRKAIAKNKLLKPIALAAALHVPLTPLGKSAIEGVSSLVHGLDAVWNRSNLVLKPQSDAEQSRVRTVINNREAGVDKSQLRAYESQASEKLEHGEEVPFKRLYFDLERLHGVPADQVTEAERKADEEIRRYSEMVGDSLDEREIQKIVGDMYGPPSNYSWGQGSVTEYFRSGKRNCDAIDRAEHIIFEGVIATLPESQRSRYRLAETHEKQHVIATLQVQGAAEGAWMTYLLQPPTETRRDPKPEPGTALIDATFLKKSTVSGRMETVSAATGMPIPPSPDINAVINEPIPRGFVVTGELRGAEFNHAQAQREGLEPVQVIEKQEGAMELTIENEITPEEAHRRVDEAAIFNRGSWKNRMMVQAFDFTNPSVETVKALQPTAEQLPSASEINVGPMESWSEKAIDELLDLPYEKVLTYTPKGKDMINPNLITALIKRRAVGGTQKNMTLRIETDLSRWERDVLLDLQKHFMDGTQFANVILHARMFKAVEIDFPIDFDEAESVRQFLETGATLHVDRVIFSTQYPLREIMNSLGESKGTVTFPPDLFGLIADQCPDCLASQHLQPDIEGADLAVLGSLERAFAKVVDKKDPRLKNIRNEMKKLEAIEFPPVIPLQKFGGV